MTENKSKAIRLGVFIVVALVILAAGVFLIGNKEFMFSSTYSLRADFPDVAGLKNGADVRVGGLREGTVSNIKLPGPPDKKVTVIMKMHQSTMGIIRKDSVASIKTEGILGDKYVDISFGSMATIAVADGDVVRAEPTVDVAEVANSIANQTQAALAVVREDMEALKQNFLLRGFFNKRGYEDSSDLTKHAISRLPSGPRIKEFTYDPQKLFEKSDSPKLGNQKVLDDAGHFLESNGFGQAIVVAASGMVGDSEKVRVQTQAQAMVIRDYLVQNFSFDDTKLKTMGLGKAKKSSDRGEIQILIYGVQSASPAKPKATSR
jgi:hypothetical protein